MGSCTAARSPCLLMDNEERNSKIVNSMAELMIVQSSRTTIWNVCIGWFVYGKHFTSKYWVVLRIETVTTVKTQRLPAMVVIVLAPLEMEVLSWQRDGSDQGNDGDNVQ